MSGRELERVRLLDADPDLGVAVPAHDLEDATERSAVGTRTFSRGVWTPADQLEADVVLYVLSGAMARRVSVEGRSSLEILGPGQVLRPRLAAGEDTVAAQAAWRVLAPSWVGVLDSRFWERMARYNSVWLALMDRSLLRSRALSMRLAIVGVPNLAVRLRLFLWHLADSYGRVGERGVIIDLPLSHEMLAELLSASRPSISKAMKELERSGDLSRVDGKRVVLHGEYAPATAASFGKAVAMGTLAEKAASVGSLAWPL